MAKQKGIIKIQGTIGDVTFYKSQDGHLAREKGGVSAEKIATDPAFQRTRENGREFGNAGASGKVLRDAVRSMMLSASDNRVTSRLTKLMTDIIKLDITSARGSRNVGVAITTNSAKAMLKGFNFNNRAILGSILFKPFALNAATGEITIGNFVPINDVIAPPGANFLTIKGAFANVNFADGTSAIEFSNLANLPIDGIASSVVLTPPAVPAGTGTSIYLLQFEFFQQVNGVQYSLKNGAYNALEIIEVL